MNPKKKMEDKIGRKRIGVWLRVSSEEQALGDSPQHHELRARHYAEAKDWQVVEIYHLEGVSGKSVVNHPETRRMMKDIERGQINALIFSKLARLGRNTKELLEFAEFFQQHDADLISLQEAIDTSTPAGRLFYTMIAAMAHWEREEIASRVAASVPVRAKLGKQLGGNAPFGYQWQDKKLVSQPEEAPIRRLIHELFLEHKRFKTVARLMNEAGHRTRKGKLFSAKSIEYMLRDSTPKGLHRANYVTWDSESKSWKLKPESEWVYQPVEPILKPELWDACAEILKERDANRKPRAKRAVQLFAGLLYCGCGQKMYVPSNTPKYVCQKCRNKIPVDDLEEIFIEQLKAYMLSPTELTSYLEAKDQDLQQRQELLDSVIREEKNLRAEMEKVFQLYMSDQLTPEGFGERHKPMEARLRQLQEEIPKLEASIDFLKVNFLSGDQILNQAKNLASFWPDMTHEHKRQVVESIVERITLGKDDIQIDLFYLPTAHQTDDHTTASNDNSDPSENGNNDDSDDHTNQRSSAQTGSSNRIYNLTGSGSNNRANSQSAVDSTTSADATSKTSTINHFLKDMAKGRTAILACAP